LSGHGGFLLLFVAILWSQPAWNGILFNNQISGEMVDDGDVAAFPPFQISPDGRHTVFIADKETDGDLELYSAPTKGSAPPVALSRALGPGTVATQFAITPDGLRVVFLAAGSAASPFELYSVPIDGGVPVKLNGSLLAAATDKSVGSFKVTPDGRQVIYTAPQDTAGRLELYRVPVGGGTSVKLSGPIAASADIITPEISPDGATVAYVVSSAGTFELFGVAMSGGAAVQLNSAYPPGATLRTFRFTPDSSRVVYAASAGNKATTLYSVPTRGGSAVTLDAGWASDITLDWGFRITADSSRVVYTLQSALGSPFELFSVPVAGGSVVKLNEPVGTGGVGQSFLVTPNSDQVLFVATRDGEPGVKLYRVPTVGGTAFELGNGATNVRLDPGGSALSSDGSRAVYVADQETAGVFEVFSVGLFGDAPVKLSGAMAPGGDADGFQTRVVPGDRVVYLADQEVAEVGELYGVALVGGPATKLNGAMVKDGDVAAWRSDVSGKVIVYRADQQVDGRFELFSTFEAQMVFLPQVIR
jgi:Tol biopolymer transport system component